LKAIIIAAGMGTRLSAISGEIPKPLTPVMGIPLLERILSVCREAGITQFVIITGYLGAKLQEYFGNGDWLNVDIEYVQNDEWEKPNGLSAYKAKAALQGEKDFLLLMSDHLFNRDMVEGIMADTSEENLLAIDKNIDGIFDLPDATKVFCEGRFITDIGKEIVEYNGIDCGMFRLKANFFEAMAEALNKGRESLSNGVAELIQAGDFAAHFISPSARWLDVDTEEAFYFAEENIHLFR